MAVASVVLLVLAFVVMLVSYVRDVRMRPGEGGGRLRYSLRWAMAVDAAVLLAVLLFGTAAPPWLEAVAAVGLILLVGSIYRGLGTGRRPQDRTRARYRPVRDRGTGVDGWRGD